MMGTFSPPRAGLRKSALLALALAASASAHSWVEYAYKIAPNGTFVGDIGFPRGYLPRNSTNPEWADIIPEWILPYAGQGHYNGQELLNEYPPNAEPAYPMLEAAAGDHVVLLHNENGHTTLPWNQRFKPENRGTIFFYGTSQPIEHERLFDVHLLWNKNGTGGDKRGKLLATRNFDDGICYQPNTGNMSVARAAELSRYGANHDKELLCQSDIKLPDDLEPGSTYTIYWYWDWPYLNPNAIDMAATAKGLYPWEGSFLRGDNNPHNFSELAITTSESYSSTVDIKITGDKAKALSFGIKEKAGNAFMEDQDVYLRAVKAQMAHNFQVDTDAPGGGTVPPTLPSTMPPTAAPVAPSPAPGVPPPGDVVPPGVSVVTQTVTVPPTTLVTTVYVTDLPGAAPPTSPSSVPLPPATSAVAVPPTTPLPSQPSEPLPSSNNPAPGIPSAVVPAPGIPTSEAPAPGVPTSEAPIPGVPTSEAPVPSIPTSSVPTPSIPAPEGTGSDGLIPSSPVSGTPTSGIPTSGVPTSGVPTLSIPAPEGTGSDGLIPSSPVPSTPTSGIPTSGSPTSDVPIPSSPGSGSPASDATPSGFSTVLATETIVVTSTAYVPTGTHHTDTTVEPSTIAQTTVEPTTIAQTTVEHTTAAQTTEAHTSGEAKLPATGAPSVTPFMARRRFRFDRRH